MGEWFKENPKYTKQLATIHSWGLVATRLGLPKDVRQLIAQKYLWDASVPRQVESEWHRFLFAPYRTEDVVAEHGLIGMFWILFFQFLGLIAAGAFVTFFKKYIVTDY